MTNLLFAARRSLRPYAWLQRGTAFLLLLAHLDLGPLIRRKTIEHADRPLRILGTPLRRKRWH